MLITKKTEISMYIVKALKYNGGVVGSALLSKLGNFDHNFTQQTILKLKRAGIVEAFRGPGGGYKLAAKFNNKVSMDDLLQAMNSNYDKRLGTGELQSLLKNMFTSYNIFDHAS